MKKYIKIIVCFAILYYLEMIMHFTLFKSLSWKSFLFLTLYTLVFSLFIDLITSLFNKTVNKIIFLAFNTFIVLLFIAQLINFKFYGNVFSVFSLFHGGQVFEWFSAIISLMKESWLNVLLLIAPIPLMFVFHKKIEFISDKYKTFALKTLIFSGLFILALISLNFDAKTIYSAKNLYFNKHVPNSTAQTFGILTTMRLDLERIITNFQEKSVIDNQGNEIPANKEVEYNITAMDFEKLIDSNNNIINNISQYIANQSATEKNEYTGLFKGKNLISIVAEAFSPIAVDPILTPTLYKLVNTGFVFNNFYTPVYYVSTSDGEYVTLNSLLPKESVWSFSKSSSNYLPYSYGNIFKNLDYTTYAFHNGQYKFYNRNKSHPNMGYDYIACGNGLEKKMNCKQWPQSDISMIDATFDYYADSENFAVYYMTISGHLEYNFFGNNMAYKNRNLVADLSYSTAIKAYIACQIELDKALEKLIQKLTDKGILNDTVIVLSADHYPYGLNTDQMKEATTYISDDKFDTQKNNLIIWNNEIKNPIVINKYAESLDVLPTVLNLFGIDFDSRLLIGSDILSNSDGLVILNDRSWITKYGKYNTATSKFTAFTSDVLPNNYVENLNNIIYNKFTISKNILETDYYSQVFGK